MWSLALALYAGCKWITLAEARKHNPRIDSRRILAYLFAWPGMDAASFFDSNSPAPKPSVAAWLFALAKMLLGAALVSVGARMVAPHHAMLAGWIGMIGIVFILHFGLFHLLALHWQSVGVNATPLMRNPLSSESLAEFWGKRWNTAFHELAHRYTFRPLARRIGVTGATLAGFLASGVVHDLVISVPARGGYGLPTAYFLIQGLGLVFERSIVGSKLGLARGKLGWLFTMLVAAVPAVWLFHPPFIHNVILPMLRSFGSI